MNEAETRDKHIDPALKAAAWGMGKGTQLVTKCHQLEMTTGDGKQRLTASKIALKKS